MQLSHWSVFVWHFWSLQFAEHESGQFFQKCSLHPVKANVFKYYVDLMYIRQKKHSEKKNKSIKVQKLTVNFHFTKFIKCVFRIGYSVHSLATFIIVNNITAVNRTCNVLVYRWSASCVFITKMTIFFICSVWNVKGKPCHSIDIWTLL